MAAGSAELPNLTKDTVNNESTCLENNMGFNLFSLNNNVEERLADSLDFEVLDTNDVKQALKSRFKSVKGNSSTSSRG